MAFSCSPDGTMGGDFSKFENVDDVTDRGRMLKEWRKRHGQGKRGPTSSHCSMQTSKMGAKPSRKRKHK